MTTERLFPSTSGPGSVTSTSGNWLTGVCFSVTGGMRWLDGYYQWVPSNGDTTPRKWALWNRYSSSAQNLVPGSVVTSGTQTLGAWNFTALNPPIQLAPGAVYVAASGYVATAGIPVTSNQFDSGQPFASGITNGFLTAWSTNTGSNTEPYNVGQMVFSTVLGSDPSVNMPNNASGADNLWVDIVVDDTPPAGYAGSYRMYPNMADAGNNFALDTANGFTLGVEFSLSQACAVNNIWFYSPATVSVLPTQTGFYRISDQSLILSNASPSWSGAAGSGWISSPFQGSLLAGVNYKQVTFQGANVIWNGAEPLYYSTGFGGSGLVAGPITVPNSAGASPGQQSYHQAASISYPDTLAGPYWYGLDFEVTPLVPPKPLNISQAVKRAAYY